MRAIVLFAFALLAAGCPERDEEKAAPSPPTGGAPAKPSPTMAPTEDVGPDGPADLAVPALAAIPTDPASIEAGKAVFETRGCGACHQFGTKLVGPDLTGVTQRRTIPWIERMILHPSEMVRRDPVAKDLFKTYLTEMTYQGVTEEELPNLLAYIKSQGG